MQRVIHVKLEKTLKGTKKGIVLNNENMLILTITKALAATQRLKFIQLIHHYLKVNDE